MRNGACRLVRLWRDRRCMQTWPFIRRAVEGKGHMQDRARLRAGARKLFRRWTSPNVGDGIRLSPPSFSFSKLLWISRSVFFGSSIYSSTNGSHPQNTRFSGPSPAPCRTFRQALQLKVPSQGSAEEEFRRDRTPSSKWKGESFASFETDYK
jgi:hypothetical protein